MSLENLKTKEASPTVLRLPPELKTELTKLAAQSDRSLSKEIIIRLRTTLAARGPTLQGILAREAEAKGVFAPPASYTEGPTPGLTAKDNGPPAGFTDLDKAMLKIFHAMPVEKQLALLSLFK